MCNRSNCDPYKYNIVTKYIIILYNNIVHYIRLVILSCAKTFIVREQYSSYIIICYINIIIISVIIIIGLYLLLLLFLYIIILPSRL